MSRVSWQVLDLDCESETKRIVRRLKDVIQNRFRRRGGVVALSGGVDSSVTAALCVKAFGPDKVFGLLMPDQDSSSETWQLSRHMAEILKIAHHLEDITPILEAEGCYRYRDEAMKKVVPEYCPGSLSKIVLSGRYGTPYRIFHLVVRLPGGEEVRVRLPSEEYRSIVAAMNFKQRTRKMLEYYHADRLHYAVIGTSNRLEIDQGFFVKLGDGAGDFKPIAHLLKSQVYQMAEYLEIPEEICRRPPTPDNYSLLQTHEEFYFPAPYDVMDLCIWSRERGIPPNEVALSLGREEQFIQDVYNDIDAKRRVADYLRSPPIGVDDHP
jgi:NAD+ synthase